MKFALWIASIGLMVLSCEAQAQNAIPITPKLEVRGKSKEEVRFEVAKLPVGKELVLTFRARLTFDKVAGFNPALKLRVNDVPIEGKHLLGKKRFEERADGQIQTMASGDRLTVPYAHDFGAADRDLDYGLRNVASTSFVFHVTPLIKEGTNILSFENLLAANNPAILLVSDLRLESRDATAMPIRKLAPTGTLPLLAPSESAVTYKVRSLPNTDLEVVIGDAAFRVESSFSTPEGRWVKGNSPYFRHQRQIEKKAEAIIVRDTFTNLTREVLPLMQNHRIPLTPTKVWIGGLAPASLKGNSTESGNPTIFATSKNAGIGMLPMDDVFQVHMKIGSDGTGIYLNDAQLALRPGATHTSEWAIIPTRSEYFTFLNAARRLRDVNFTIDGPGAFLRADPAFLAKWTDDDLVEFANNKSLRSLIISIDQPRYQGLYPHGTVFQKLDLKTWKDAIAKRRRLIPDVKQFGYFHCYLEVLEEAEKLYPDARVLNLDGSQVHYGNPREQVFFPTKHNAFGKEIARNIDVILGDLGMDGVYWDEMAYSVKRYHYGEPWDGVSADIDLKTMQATKLKSAVPLLAQEFQAREIRRILDRGLLIGNGPPLTRTLGAFHFPRFVETANLSNCVQAQLFTPIALGDHLVERNEEDAYHVMLRALDYGCAYYWYDDVFRPTHPTITRYMYPLTPIELHHGAILAKERILTNRSGHYGWGDTSGHEVHVFDHTGREVVGFRAPLEIRNGKHYTELRLPEDWSAAIVRVNK